MLTTDQILRPAQVADLLGISVVSLWRLRKRGDFPTAFKICGGRIVGWKASTINMWISENFQEKQNGA